MAPRSTVSTPPAASPVSGILPSAPRLSAPKHRAGLGGTLRPATRASRCNRLSRSRSTSHEADAVRLEVSEQKRSQLTRLLLGDHWKQPPRGCRHHDYGLVRVQLLMGH